MDKSNVASHASLEQQSSCMSGADVCHSERVSADLNKLLKPFRFGLATGESCSEPGWLKGPGACCSSPSAGCATELALLLALLSRDGSCGTLLSCLHFIYCALMPSSTMRHVLVEVEDLLSKC